jgi:hypothetical protein
MNDDGIATVQLQARLAVQLQLLQAKAKFLAAQARSKLLAGFLKPKKHVSAYHSAIFLFFSKSASERLEMDFRRRFEYFRALKRRKTNTL